jgi:hypothetical protein
MKNNQKGFANIILIGVIIILVVVGGYFLWSQKSKPAVEQPVQTPTITQTDTTITTPTTNDKTANWKTYTNSKYGFEFKYPASFMGPEERSLLQSKGVNIDFSAPNLKTITVFVTELDKPRTIQQDFNDFKEGNWLTLKPEFCLGGGQVSFTTVSNEKALLIECNRKKEKEFENFTSSASFVFYYNNIGFSVSINDNDDTSRLQTINGIISTFKFTK